MNKKLTGVLRFALVFFLIFYPFVLTAAEAQPQQEAPPQPTAAEDLGYGVVSVLASLFYSPAKITYAGLGLLTGGLGYALTGGDPDVANRIIYPAIGGNYVITPTHLRGEEAVIFVGPAPLPSAQPQSAADPSSPPQR
jgi:hypothetical protein